MAEKAKPSHIGHRQRLKTKFKSNGLDSFLDHEVLELLLTYSIPRKDTKKSAWSLLDRFGSLSRVLDAKPEELSKVPGIGAETALFIPFVRGMIKRYFLDDIKGNYTVKTPEDVVTYCRASLEGEKNEFFEIIFLNAKNVILGVERIAGGTINHTTISVRTIVEKSLEKRALSLIFLHNHPSGTPEPSREDITLTQSLVNALSALELSVQDHIIVGKNSYYSFRAHGLIK